jgi:hypothetical protein
LSVTIAPLATVMVVPVTVGGGGGRFGSTGAAFGPVAKALMVGGVFGGGITIGTSSVAVADCGTIPPWPPTINEKLRFCGPATVGVTKLARALVGLLMVTIGSPGLTTCAHWNGPVGGVLAVPSSVTVMPANGGFGFEVNWGRATVANVPGMQVSGGSVLSGKGFNCPCCWLG